jgi:hypothetical protein
MPRHGLPGWIYLSSRPASWFRKPSRTVASARLGAAASVGSSYKLSAFFFLGLPVLPAETTISDSDGRRSVIWYLGTGPGPGPLPGHGRAWVTSPGGGR